MQRISFRYLSKLVGVVRMKDRSSLRDLGGVKGVIKALGTHPEKGIPDDIEARNKFFNRYSQLTNLDHAVVIVSLVSCITVSLCFAIKHNKFMDMFLIMQPVLALVIVSSIMSFLMFSLPDHDLPYAPKLLDYTPQVEVVRKGVWRKISIYRIVVGDVVFLKAGDQVPGDGLFIQGHSLQLATVGGNPGCVEVGEANPFIFSGCMVVQGYSRMVVTAVASKLPRLTSKIAQLGKPFALIAAVWLFFRYYCIQKSYRVVKGENGDVVDLLISLAGTVATSAVVASASSLVGLVLALKLTLLQSMHSLLKDHVLIKHAAICHQVASVDTVCFNKTGTLTSDFFEVKKFWLGLSSMEAVPHNTIAPIVLELLRQTAGLSTTLPCQSSTSTSSTNLMEKPIYEWATHQLGMEPKKLWDGCITLKVEPFNRARGWGGMLISKSKGIHLHRKGAADVILAMCSHYYEYSGAVNAISNNARVLIEQIIKEMEGNGLRCIAFAHQKTSIEEYFNISEQKLTLLGLVGVQNAVRNGITQTVIDCQKAGINSMLLTGDSILTATFMALRGGLLNSDFKPGQVVGGREFRNFTTKERLEKVHQIRVLAKATPSDKLLMVESLKQNGRVVAYLGGGQGDAQALKEADVGICFGTQGRAEILKACSDIVVEKKHFPLVIEILKWGRGSYHNIQTYTQFFLTATIVGPVVNFMMAMFPSCFFPIFYTLAVGSSGEVQMPVFELLWLKLVLCIVAVLQVLQPSDDLMSKPARDPEEPLITAGMQRNVIAQALYQTLVLLGMHFQGNSVLNLNPDEKNAVIFNTYVLCQVFTLINTKLYDRKNIFQEIYNKKWFWGIIGIITVLQVIMVEIWKSIAGTAKLDARQWGLCIFMAAASTPISWLLRYIFPVNIPYLSAKGFSLKSMIQKYHDITSLPYPLLSVLNAYKTSNL